MTKFFQCLKQQNNASDHGLLPSPRVPSWSQIIVPVASTNIMSSSSRSSLTLSVTNITLD